MRIEMQQSEPPPPRIIDCGVGVPQIRWGDEAFAPALIISEHSYKFRKCLVKIFYLQMLLIIKLIFITFLLAINNFSSDGGEYVSVRCTSIAKYKIPSLTHFPPHFCERVFPDLLLVQNKGQSIDIRNLLHLTFKLLQDH